MQTTTSELLL